MIYKFEQMITFVSNNTDFFLWFFMFGSYHNNLCCNSAQLYALSFVKKAENLKN